MANRSLRLSRAAKAAACPVNRVRKVLPASLVALENLVLLANQVTLESLQLRHASRRRPRHASHAHKAHPDLQAPLVLLVTPARLAPLADLATMLHQVHLVLVVLPAHLANPVQSAHPANLVFPL